ncbi:MAG: hypothetical protein JWP64_2209 [Pseudonocardia sp.]|uniref:hypothetical protein n=1 Tax=Pseudonocardia sp. TaxID=60912 RepID=UPI0026245839|nr:hypothetical protein [Pseudonocardia sp.]MCU1627260.1 hypothetical protein [Pseudonocardia sp.]
MRALAVARFLAADAIRSRRVLIPVFLYAAVLAVLFGGDPGPPPAPWAASALALYPIAAWLALTVANTEDPVQRTVTVAASGGHLPVAAGTLLVALAGDVVLSLLSVVWPVVATGYPHPPGLLMEGFLGHLACASTGTAVGLLCARPVIGRIGWSLMVAVFVVVVTGVQPWLPPVGTSVAALEAGAGTSPVAFGALLGLVLAGAAAGVSAAVARRL